MSASSLSPGQRQAAGANQRSGRRYQRRVDSGTSLGSSTSPPQPGAHTGGGSTGTSTGTKVKSPMTSSQTASPMSRSGNGQAEGAHETIKLLMLGDSAVGKTCLMVRFNEDVFMSGNFISTVGIDFRTKKIELDQRTIHLEIWDTAGQERFRSITSSYYRNSDAILLVYDVSNVSSYEHLSGWLSAIKELAPSDVSLLLLANKCDVTSGERRVTEQAGVSLAQQHNIAVVDVSAKTGVNVNLAFEAVARSVLAKRAQQAGTSDKGKHPSAHPPGDKFDMGKYVSDNSEKSACAC